MLFACCTNALRLLLGIYDTAYFFVTRRVGFGNEVRTAVT